MHGIRVEAWFEEDRGEVFRRVSDHARFLTAGSVRCRVIVAGDPAPNGLGAVREVRNGPVRFEEVITAFEPSSHYAYRIRRLQGPLGLALPVVHEGGSVTVEDGEERGGTQVIWQSRFRVAVPLLGAALERAIGPAFRKAFARLLARAGGRPR